MYQTNKYDNTELLNLPRFVWVDKSMTLKELHFFVFDYFKELILRFYALDEVQRKNNLKAEPNIKHPDT